LHTEQLARAPEHNLLGSVTMGNTPYPQRYTTGIVDDKVNGIGVFTFAPLNYSREAEIGRRIIGGDFH
jgi:hypothetical protein